MGQAKRKRDQEERKYRQHESESFPESLQRCASEIARTAEYLVGNKTAEWKKVVMPDGEHHIALTFPAKFWQVIDGKITLRTE